MILSKKNKFIYVRTRKVGSSTFEAVISECLGPDDIITKNDDIENFKKSSNFLTARNYEYTDKYLLFKKILNNSYYNLKNLVKLIIYKKKNKNLPFYPHKFYDHISIERIKSRVDRVEYSTFLKFIISRDPINQIKSFYFWSSSDFKYSFDEYVEKFSYEFFRKDLELYSIQNKIEINKLLIFEEMETDLKKMLDYFNVKNTQILENYRSLKLKKLSKNISISNFAKNLIFKNAEKQFELREKKGLRF